MIAASKKSTERVRRHRERAKAGLVRVVFVLEQAQAEALIKARIIQEWNSPRENSDAVAALIQQKLGELLKT